MYTRIVTSLVHDKKNIDAKNTSPSEAQKKEKIGKQKEP
jgi:hypothetical protein